MCVALLKTSHFYSTLPVERLVQPTRSEKLEDVEAMRRAGRLRADGWRDRRLRQPMGA